jgi:hypothetical protein
MPEKFYDIGACGQFYYKIQNNLCHYWHHLSQNCNKYDERGVN